MKEIKKAQGLIIIKTLSGSAYEIIEQEKKIRRLYGNEGPTPRQGTDGEWKEYFSLSLYDDILIIFWNDSGKATMTSPIVEFSFDGDNSKMN